MVATGKLSCSTGSQFPTIAVVLRLRLSWVWLTGSSGVQSHAVFIVLAFLLKTYINLHLPYFFLITKLEEFLHPFFL